LEIYKKKDPSFLKIYKKNYKYIIILIILLVKLCYNYIGRSYKLESILSKSLVKA